MNSNNKISIFAQNATEVSTEQDGSIGYVYDDNTWRGGSSGFEPRVDGAYQGVAKSIDYNTALRQSTLMSAVLAEILAIRNSKTSDNGYSYMSSNGIGTIFTGEGSLETHVSNLANIFANGKFLNDSEVITSKINNKAVTTAKINDNAVTSSQLGSIIGTGSSTSNGMTVSLSQSSNKGALSISISGTSVTNANKINIQSTSNRVYLTGPSSTSSLPSSYQNLYGNSNVYMQSGTLYTTNSISSGYMQAASFYATSDIRKKCDIYGVNHNAIKEIVENVDIQHFKYIDNKKDYIGIIAQDVDKYQIDNFKITEKGEDGYLVVQESKLVYILWDYIQQLNKRISELEK